MRGNMMGRVSAGTLVNHGKLRAGKSENPPPRRARVLHLVLICLNFALFGLTATQAATYYVSTTGSDNNNGTSLSTPWRTINKAAQTMVAGDTVYIRGGTYRESVSPAH